MYLTENKVDLWAGKSLTRGLTMRPESLGLGGTNSTIKSFPEELLTSKTTSSCSFSGRAGNSIFYLSVEIGHLTTFVM